MSDLSKILAVLDQKSKFTEFSLLELGLVIRHTENKLIELFQQGILSGTVHTCVGQELGAVLVVNELLSDDFIFSNHRCHGHFIAHGGEVSSLIGELAGRESGVCSGLGGSQHLHKKNFYSNGIQGSIVPVAAGIALAGRLDDKNSIGVVFIGDGTLGQGIVYESMNMAALYDVPLLIVCEDNSYAQSTPKFLNLAGSIELRANAFGLPYYHADTFDIEQLTSSVKSAIDDVRINKRPVFLHIDTYRLNAHSKGDDLREIKEIQSYQHKDILNRLLSLNNSKVDAANKKVLKLVNQAAQKAQLDKFSTFSYKSIDVHDVALGSEVKFLQLGTFEGTVSQRINEFFHQTMSTDSKLIFMGEDVLSPYGGAFKVAANLSDKFKERVFSTPISEPAMTGFANGLALGGYKTYLEFMFGDFVALGADQIINSATKFHHMFGYKVSCPVVYRVPMGGGRGYGPTHSQSLEKIFLGIDNLVVIAINRLLDPFEIYKGVNQCINPVMVVEYKSDYPKKMLGQELALFNKQVVDHIFPEVVLLPGADDEPEATIFTYGGNVELALEMANLLFFEYEINAQVIVVTQISPLRINHLNNLSKLSKLIITLEECSISNGFGSELIAGLASIRNDFFQGIRIGAKPFPIPAATHLEKEVLPNIDKIREILKEHLK
jgi:2-oxoisovalerate dehydrogenase E1 component